MLKELEKTKDALRKLNFILSSEQKKYGIFILILSLLAAILETVGVSAILPLMQVMLDAESLLYYDKLQPIIMFFGIRTATELIIAICVGVIIIYVVKNIYFIFFTWISKKYTYKVRRELSTRVLEAYMRQGYIFFVNNNSSRLLQGISSDTVGVYTIINSLFTLITKFLTIGAIGIYIIVQSPLIAVALLGMVIFCIALIQLVYSKSMRKYGALQRAYSWHSTQTTLEAIHGNKEIIVMNRQKYFTKRYAENTETLNRASIKVDMGAATPAYIIESVCIAGLLTVVALQIGAMDNLYGLITQLSTIAVAAFRILPGVGAITSAINTITFSIPSMNAAYDTLAQVKELEKTFEEESTQSETWDGQIEKPVFKQELSLEHVAYHYPGMDENVLEDINLKVRYGTSVALIGSSGAGKTTLADIILALLKPCNGSIKVDDTSIDELGSAWHKLIGYIPQAVYLVDDSVRKNIAFGIEDEQIDDQKVWNALEMAQLKDFIMDLPEQLDTRVGERGVRLSGGQRQRIAIARALYEDPDILVMDEATAALDNETETAVMKSIDALQGYKTLIIVAHRLTTIRNCDEIYEIRDGRAWLRAKSEIFPNG